MAKILLKSCRCKALRGTVRETTWIQVSHGAAGIQADAKEHQPQFWADKTGAARGFLLLSQEHSCKNVFIKNQVKMGNATCLLAGLPTPADTSSRNIPLRDQDFQPAQGRSGATKNCQAPKIREAEEDSQVPVSTLSTDHVGLLTLGHSKNTLGLGQPLHGMAQWRKLLKTSQNPAGFGATEPSGAGGAVMMGLGSHSRLWWWRRNTY